MASEIRSKLAAAYAAWHESRGTTPQHFFALMADDILVHSILENSFAGEPLGRSFSGRSEVLTYYAVLAEGWEMVSATTDSILAEGNRAVWIGRACWRSRKTLKQMDSPKVDLWTFNSEGKATELFEMYDSYPYAVLSGRIPAPEQS
ncbi:MAG: nuclear transport factor 2 family protein [Sphingomonadaceae bacterium]|nr:nuclear transport factor 2 family protein [Sphingomonadaceae bacterium]